LRGRRKIAIASFCPPRTPEVQDVLAVLPGADFIPNQLSVDPNLVAVLRQRRREARLRA
jgi:hypothetical protein